MPYSDNTVPEQTIIEKDTSNIYCRILLDVLQSQGVHDAIASPGSRNAPLLISLAGRAAIDTRIVTDERNAAFVALGISMIRRAPVMLCCTSGTALYNYAPAVAEAFHQHLPLIIISADRPFEWIDQYDSQTLHQAGALDKIVKKSFDIPVMDAREDMEWYVNRIANEAFNLATEGLSGPVHINIQLAPPLDKTVMVERKIPRLIRTINSIPWFSETVISSIADKMTDRKILVIAGFMAPNAELNKALSLFSTLPGVAIAAETLSNLHLRNHCYDIDTLLGGLPEKDKTGLEPDLVIQIGGAPVSRMIKDFCRNITELEVWTLSDTEPGADCLQGLACHIRIPPAFFFKALYHRLNRIYRKNKVNLSAETKDFSNLWESLRIKQYTAKERFVESLGWCELQAFREILGSLPGNYNLFLSNGTPVRYGQLFARTVPHASYSNRGVSGIEGTTATASGCAVAYKGPTLLITGDMSFGYAPEVLGLPFIPDRFKIIVINNKGGGIFRFIPSTCHLECRESHFCADPGVPIEAVARSHGWDYIRVCTAEDLVDRFFTFIHTSNKSLMEIMIPEEYSADALRKYMDISYTNQ